MSVEIVFDTTDAQSKVDALGEALLDLADKAEQGSKGVNQKLSFGADALKELRALRQEMESLRAAVKGFGDGVTEQVRAQETLRKQAADSAQATIAQATALRTLQRTQKDSTDAMVSDKKRIVQAEKDNADQISGYLKRQNDAYDTSTHTHRVSVAQREENLKAWQAALKEDEQRTRASLKLEQQAYEEDAARTKEIIAKKSKDLAQVEANRFKLDTELRNEYMRAEADAYKEDAARTKSIKENAAKQEADIERNKFRLETELRNEYMQAEAAAYKEDAARTAAAVKKRADAEIAALKTVQNELKNTINAESNYASKVAALGTLRSINSVDSSKGINSQQYASALSLARKEMLAAEMQAGKLALGITNLNSRMAVGTQAAAGLRAGMQGAGLGFGGFAASTVATAAGVFAVTSALKDSIETGSQFQFAFQRAAAILGEFTKQASGNELSDAGRRLEEEVLRISTSSQYSAKEVAEAVKELAQAGMSTGEVMANLRPILNTATVGLISVADAAKITANVIAQFGLSADSAGRVGDILAKAANVSTIEIADLAKSLQYAGTISHLAGESLETTAAAIALLGQAGIKGSKGGTALRDVILDLASAENKSTKAGKAFAKLGIEISKNAAGGVDLERTFNDLFKALDKLPESEKLGTLIQIFGKIGSTGAAALMKFAGSVTQTGTVFTDFLHKVTNDSNGYSQSLAALFNDNVQTAFKNLLATFDVISIKAFGVFGGPLQAKIKEFTQYLAENQDSIAKNLAGIMTSLITLAEFIVSYGPQILGVLEAFIAFKIAKGIFTAVAEGVILVNGALKIFKAEALSAALAAEVMGTASVTTAAGVTTLAGASSVAGAGLRSLLPLVGGIPGLMAAAGVGAYFLGTKLGKMADEVDRPKTEFQELISLMNRLKTSSQDIGKMSGSDALAYFKKVEDGAKRVQVELIKANEAVANASVARDKAVSLATALPNSESAQSNATAATIRWNEARGQAIILSKQLNAALAEESAAFVNIASQTAEGAAFFNSLTQAMTEMYAIGSLISRLGTGGKMLGGMFEGVSSYANGFLDFTKQLNDNIQASNKAKQAAKEHADEEGRRAAAAAESKSRVRELASELKSIIKDFGSTTGEIADMNRQLSQVDAIEKQLSQGKIAQVLNDIGASASLARDALDWKKGQIVLDTVSAALGNLDPRFKDLTATIKNSNKGVSDFSTLMQLATEIVNKSTLSDERKKVVLQEISQAMQDVADGTANLATKMDGFINNARQSWEQFNTTDTMEGRIQSWGRAFAGASAEQRRNAEISSAQASVVKMLGSDYAASISPMMAYRDGVAALNFLESQGIQIVGGYARARQKLYEQTPVGQIEKQNTALAKQLQVMQLGGDAAEIYSIALQAVGNDVSLITPEVLAAAEGQRQLNARISELQELQGTFKSFADSLAGVFADVFTGGIKNFKDFTSKIKDSFRNLLRDLVQQAIRNQLFQWLGITQGSGSNAGGGLFGSLISMFTGSGGAGGGGGTNWSQIATIGSGSGGNTSGWSISDIAALAAGNYTGGTTAGAGGGSGSPWLDFLSNGSSAYRTYNSLGGYAGAWYGSGQTTWLGSQMGTAMYGPGMQTAWAPSGFGAAAGIAGGAYAAYNRWNDRYDTGTGALGAAAYGIGTVGAIGALGGIAGGAGAMAGMAGGMSTIGLAAIPVIGWIALAAMLVDMISGGGLFGTSAKPNKGWSTLSLGPEGASIESFMDMKGKKPLFGGSYHETQRLDVSPEAQAAANKLYESMLKGTNQFAKQFGATVGELASGSFTTEFDKKGNVTKTKSNVGGVERKEDQEAFIKRMQAENYTNVLKSIGVDITKYTHDFIDNADDYLTSVQDASTVIMNAKNDMKADNGLLDGDNALQRVFDMMVDMQRQGESLADTYSRVKQSVDLVTTTLDPLKTNLGKTREEYINWSVELIDSLGGLQNATAIMQNVQSMLDSLNPNAMLDNLELAKKKLYASLSDIGVSIGISSADFSAKFKEMLPKLTPEEAANWIRAANNFAIFKKMQEDIANQLGDLMTNVRGELAKFTGREYVFQMEQVNKQMEQSIAQARRLGASEDQLNDIRQLAAYQIADLIAKLRAEIGNAATQLYGKMGTDGIRRMQDEQTQRQLDGISAVTEAQKNMYEAAQDAIKSITDFLKELKTGDLAPTGTKGKLSAASAQFEETLRKALAGDPEAMGNLTSDAQKYLELAQQYFGTGVDYGQIYDRVTTALEQAKRAFEAIKNPGDGNTGSGGNSSNSEQTVKLTDQERYQLALQLAQDIGQLGIASKVDILTLMKGFGVDIKNLAHDLGIDINKWTDETGPNISIMAKALGVTVPDLIEMLGGKSDEIAKFYGIKADEIIAGNYDALTKMAESLGINVLDALNLVGIPITTLLESMGVNIGTLTAQTPAQLAAVAEKFGLSVLDLMGAAGISMTDLVTAWNNGIPITKLDATSAAALASIAGTLGINVVQLLTAMGNDAHTTATQLSDYVTKQLDKIPDLPEGIKESLTTLFAELAKADTADEIAESSKNISDYVNSLPEDIKSKLTDLLKPLGLMMGPDEATLSDVDSSITDVKDATQTVATNTGEDGPIVRELKRIAGGTQAAAANAQASSSMSQANGTMASFEIPGALEASQAMANAFFDATINPEDFGESSSSSSDYNGYYEDASTTSNVHTGTGTTHAAKTAEAAEKTARCIESMQVQIAALHAEMAAQTKRLADIGERGVNATEINTKAVKNKGR